MLKGGATFLGASFLFRKSLGEMLFWLCIVLGAFIELLGWRDLRPASHRRKSAIRVSSAGFDVNGKSFSRAAVRRLLVRNPLHLTSPRER
jgi:hypothetical protein